MAAAAVVAAGVVHYRGQKTPALLSDSPAKKPKLVIHSVKLFPVKYSVKNPLIRMPHKKSHSTKALLLNFSQKNIFSSFKTSPFKLCYTHFVR